MKLQIANCKLQIDKCAESQASRTRQPPPRRSNANLQFAFCNLHFAITLSSTFALLLLASALSGCAGYQIGAAALYPPDIRTVYVPMFESNSFRRHLGERLTEAVMKEIERNTPFKVVGTPNADSVLTGRIISETKGLVVESPTDEPRLVEVNLAVEVTWVDRSGDVLRQGVIPLPPAVATVSQPAKFAPEVGSSVATAHQDAIQTLAEQIRGLMESPW